MGCSKCDRGFVFKRCCSGLSEMCGCMGYPVAVTNCKECNPDNKDPTDPDMIEQLQYVGWSDE